MPDRGAQRACAQPEAAHKPALARANLERLGYNNVSTEIGDGYQGKATYNAAEARVIALSPSRLRRLLPMFDAAENGNDESGSSAQQSPRVYLFPHSVAEVIEKHLEPLDIFDKFLCLLTICRAFNEGIPQIPEMAHARSTVSGSVLHKFELLEIVARPVLFCD